MFRDPQKGMEATLAAAPVVPVMVIENAADAVPLAKALVKGGFAFEYSATFSQSVAKGSTVAKAEEDILKAKAKRLFDKTLKQLDDTERAQLQLTAEDRALFVQAESVLAAAREAMDRQAIHRALEAIFSLVSEADRYIDAQAPWTLRKTDPERMKVVLYTVAETVRRIAILLTPFVPASANKLLDLVAVPEEKRGFDSIGDMLVSGTELPAPQGVFPRYVDKEDA